MEPEANFRVVSSSNSSSNSPMESNNGTVTTGNNVGLRNTGDCTVAAATVAFGKSDNIDATISEDKNDDAGVIAAPAVASLNTSSSSGGVAGPAEIPLGEEEQSVTNNLTVSSNGGKGNKESNTNQDDDDEEDDESEYEYEDDDDAAFSGFLVDHPALAAQSMETGSNNNDNSGGGNDGSVDSPARIRDEEESEDNNAAASSAPDAGEDATDTGDATAENNKKPRWREPSRAAVSMSLRAEREKTGSKRRLAQDLYRIMNQDTLEAGFSIQPKSEDNMDHWVIKLFKFDPDSNLAKDMMVLGFEHVELEMSFPDQYPFEPPFVRVVRPRFKRQTGFVMNGALCMELLTKDGWNPVNDIESVIVSIRSLLVVGDGRLQAAFEMAESKYQARLKAYKKSAEEEQARKRQKREDDSSVSAPTKDDGGSYSVAEAHAAYSHLSDYHKKKGWDSSGWWARKG